MKKVIAEVKLKINIDSNKNVQEIEENIKDFIINGKYTIKDVSFKLVNK